MTNLSRPLAGLALALLTLLALLEPFLDVSVDFTVNFQSEYAGPPDSYVPVAGSITATVTVNPAPGVSEADLNALFASFDESVLLADLTLLIGPGSLGDLGTHPFSVFVGRPGEPGYNPPPWTFEVTTVSASALTPVGSAGSKAPVGVKSSLHWTLSGKRFVNPQFNPETGITRYDVESTGLDTGSELLDDRTVLAVATPEPGSWALTGLGLLALAGVRRRWRAR